MYKIGMDIDRKLEMILEEILDYELYSAENFYTEKIGGVDIILLDLSKKDIKEKLKYFKKMEIPVIVLCEEEDFYFIRESFRKEYVVDAILKRDYFEIERAIETILAKRKNLQEVVINAISYKAIVKISDIIYVTYCRVNRKTEIVDMLGNMYESKKGFSEVEEKIESDFLIKVERGTLVNKNMVRKIDYKNEKVFFIGGESLSLSKAKLKMLEDMVDIFKNRVEL